MTRSLPVLTYHYISRKVDGIAMPPDLFEDQVRTMTRAGYAAVGLDEALDYFLSGRKLPRKACLLTFDDGFLDAYVHAWPILKRYGQKGIVFAVAGKLEPAAPPRPTLDDLWQGRIRAENLPPVDAQDAMGEQGHLQRRDLFLNFEEARILEAGGVMRLACHSYKHRRVFAGPEYDGFHQPGHRRHTFDQVESPAPWGLPRFRTAPGFSQCAFLPSKEVLEAARAMVPQDTESAHVFFQDRRTAKRLAQFFAGLPKDRLGRYETPEEFRSRIRMELSACKALLEDELGRPQRALAWPWGVYASEAYEVARQIGFQVFFATTMGPNPPGKPDHIHRFKAKPKGPFWVKSRLFIYSNPRLARLYAAARI